MSHVQRHFSLTFSGLNFFLNTTPVNFCKTITLMVCINQLFCASILLSTDKMDSLLFALEGTYPSISSGFANIIDIYIYIYKGRGWGWHRQRQHNRDRGDGSG